MDLLRQSFLANNFNQAAIPTIGFDFTVKRVQVGGRAADLQIWDTAGQERFHKITRTYYRGAHGIVLVFDVTARKSFQNLDW